MENFNIPLTTHFKRYLNTLSVPLADHAVFGETEAAMTTHLKSAVSSLTQALSASVSTSDMYWRETASRLQQAQTPLSPWPGALHWQNSLARLQQGLAGEETLLPENLLEESIDDTLLALPDMPEPDDDLFAMEGGSVELDTLFSDTTPDNVSAPIPVVTEPEADIPEPEVEAMLAEVDVVEPEFEEDINAAIGALDHESVKSSTHTSIAASEPISPASQTTSNPFTEMPWNSGSDVSTSPATKTVDVKEKVTHLHVPAGQHIHQAEQLSEHAPQATQNPILAATQQALQTAEFATTEQVETTSDTQEKTIKLPSADPKKHNSKEFFSSLPWGGTHSS